MLTIERQNETTTISAHDLAALSIFHAWPEGISGALLTCAGDDGAGLNIQNAFLLRRLLSVLLAPEALRAAGVDSDPALGAAARLQAEIGAVG